MPDMSKLTSDITSLGELGALWELLRLRNSPASIRSAVGRAEIIRVRKGWYCLPSLASPFQAAARVGGRLTCVSLAEAAGLWIPAGSHGLHVAVMEHATQLRSTRNYHDRLGSDGEPDVVIHWTDGNRAQANGTRYSTDLSTALLRITRCLDVESAFVLGESALFQRLISKRQWRDVLDEIPPAVRLRLAVATSFSESGSESIFSFRASQFGIRVRQQVKLGTDRVDFLLGDRLVIEIDSVAHHDPTEDARRDARLSRLGYRVLRFMYSQLMGEWPAVYAAVVAAISRGDHLAA
jgi:very-short-patch-repair endonuclease